MPIVQIKIVQKRAAHQADFIGMAMPVQVEPVGDAGHPQAMLVGGDGAVLDELLHLQRMGVIGNAAQDLVHTCFLRRRQLANHRRHLPSLLVTFIIPRTPTISNGAGEISQLQFFFVSFNEIITFVHKCSADFEPCPLSMQRSRGDFYCSFSFLGR